MSSKSYSGSINYCHCGLPLEFGMWATTCLLVNSLSLPRCTPGRVTWFHFVSLQGLVG